MQVQINRAKDANANDGEQQQRRTKSRVDGRLANGAACGAAQFLGTVRAALPTPSFALFLLYLMNFFGLRWQAQWHVARLGKFQQMAIKFRLVAIAVAVASAL